jgi:hypothetical protein
METRWFHGIHVAGFPEGVKQIDGAKGLRE